MRLVPQGQYKKQIAPRQIPPRGLVFRVLSFPNGLRRVDLTKTPLWPHGCVGVLLPLTGGSGGVGTVARHRPPETWDPLGRSLV